MVKRIFIINDGFSTPPFDQPYAACGLSSMPETFTCTYALPQIPRGVALHMEHAGSECTDGSFHMRRSHGAADKLQTLVDDDDGWMEGWISSSNVMPSSRASHVERQLVARHSAVRMYMYPTRGWGYVMAMFAKGGDFQAKSQGQGREEVCDSAGDCWRVDWRSAWLEGQLVCIFGVQSRRVLELER